MLFGRRKPSPLPKRLPWVSGRGPCWRTGFDLRSATTICSAASCPISCRADLSARASKRGPVMPCADLSS